MQCFVDWRPTHAGPCDIERVREFDVLEQEQKRLQGVVIAGSGGILAPVHATTHTRTAVLAIPASVHAQPLLSQPLRLVSQEWVRKRGR